jgi:hypothetical protein
MTHAAPSAGLARGGMTLVEMLVATAATLILMGAIAQVFSVFGSAVTNSRAMIEQDARIRSVAWRLRSDLAGITARLLPPLEPTAGEGYFEVIEGRRSDGYDASGAVLASSDIEGDTDDVILFTTRSGDTPFVGKAASKLVESQTAEVAWFLRSTPGTSNPTTYTLYRRQLLVVGYAGFSPFTTGSNNSTAFSSFGSQWNSYYDSYDISARLEGSALVPNTLADLTRRESRFLHSGVFPHVFSAGANGQIFDVGLASPRVGEDVVLSNVIAFDVRVFDPAAEVTVAGDDAAVPGDTAFSSGNANGCYVDLGNGFAITGPSISTPPHFFSTGTANGFPNQQTLLNRRTYDTWSTHFESNGSDEDGVYGADQGTNGLDDDADGLVDEDDEQETAPPYPYPLRGIEVRIRCFEPASRLVRQVTVRQTFVPH